MCHHRAEWGDEYFDPKQWLRVCGAAAADVAQQPAACQMCGSALSRLAGFFFIFFQWPLKQQIAIETCCHHNTDKIKLFLLSVTGWLRIFANGAPT